MEVLYRETFVNDTIVLDDKRLIECRVTDCKVVHAGGNYEYDENTTFENCTPILTGDALKPFSS
jgi:hypothetical protein